MAWLEIFFKNQGLLIYQGRKRELNWNYSIKNWMKFADFTSLFMF